MPTTHVPPGASQHLQDIADTLGKSRKVVVVTGAGISTNCGIPDFRSENGLYQMIQERYNEALLNPPWEDDNTNEIDNRPRKKRKTWYYEVIAADGEVVGVIDEDRNSPKQANDGPRPSEPLSSNATTSTSRSSTPGRNSECSSLSSCPSVLPEGLEQETSDESPCITISPMTARPSCTLLTSSEAEANPSSMSLPAKALALRKVGLDKTISNGLIQTSLSSVQNKAEGDETIAQSQPNSPEPGGPIAVSQQAQSSTLQQTEIEPRPVRGASDLSSEPLILQTTPRRILGETGSTGPLDEISSSPLSPSPTNIQTPTSTEVQSTSNTLKPPPSPLPVPRRPESIPSSPLSDLSSIEDPTEAPVISRKRSIASISTDSDLSSSPPQESSIPASQTQRRPLAKKESTLASLRSEESNTQPSSQASRTSLPNLKGRDMFDAMIWSDRLSTSIFYMFISTLRQKVLEVSNTTESHRFLRVLRDGGRLVRNYTQNIDMLEEREGLSTNLHLGPGNKSRFNSKSQRHSVSGLPGDDQHQHRGCECVPLHGTLLRLRCQVCAKHADWDEDSRMPTTLSGSAPDCPSCSEYSAKRASSGRRGLGVGRLRPDIVLYGEENPCDNLIAPIVTHDLLLGPDVLLIMGTSLKVHGLKTMIREFAKAVHAKNGKVIFVNNTKPPESTWGDVLDYWVEWDCDEWVLDLKERREDIWYPQGITVEVTKKIEKTKEPATKLKPRSKLIQRTPAIREDKMSGAYVTFKILDTLRALKDSAGKMADRNLYWPTKRPSISPENLTFVKPKIPVRKRNIAQVRLQKPKGQLLKPNSSKARKPKPKPTPQMVQDARVDNPKSISNIVAEYWAHLREIAPELNFTPREFVKPLSKFKGNTKPFNYGSVSNQFPSLGLKSDQKLFNDKLVSSMNLHSLPPQDATVGSPKRPVYRVSHSYKTRASIKHEPLPTLPLSTTLPAPPALSQVIGPESQATPDTTRIKRIGSIESLLSSPEDEWHSARESVGST